MTRGLWLAAAVLAPRLLAMFVNENLGGDAIARTWLAHRWLAAPQVITSFLGGGKQFGPLHLYLLALAETAWPSLLHAGRVVSLLAGTLTAWPLYALTDRLFGKPAATFAVLGFAFWGLHVQCSSTSASEALNLLLVVSAVALFERAARPGPAWWGVALLLNLACMTRYDSWLLVPLLAAAQWWRSGSLGRALALGGASSAFAAVWLWGNQMEAGDAFVAIRYIDDFHRSWWPAEASLHGPWAYRLMCLVFWPAVAVITLTPAVALAGLVMLRRAWVQRPELRWLVLLVVLPGALYTFRSVVLESFAPLARFTMKEVVLLLPFSGYGLAQLGAWRAPWARAAVIGAAAWCVALGAWCFRPDSRWPVTFRSIAATSRIETDLRVTTRWLEAHAAPSGGLLVVDEDLAGFDDLPLSYFSGFPFEDQLRRRWELYALVLGTATPRWLLLFEAGRMRRAGEVTVLEGDQLEYRGRRYQLRHQARVRVFERID